MDETSEQRLMRYGPYQIRKGGHKWEVRGRYDKLVVSGCDTEQQAVEIALQKVRCANAMKYLNGLNTIWLF